MLVPILEREVRSQQIASSARSLLRGEDKDAAPGDEMKVNLPAKDGVEGADAAKKKKSKDDYYGGGKKEEDDAQSTSSDDAQEDFIRAIQARTRLATNMKKQYSVRTLVKEHGQDAVATDWAMVFR